MWIDKSHVGIGSRETLLEERPNKGNQIMELCSVKSWKSVSLYACFVLTLFPQTSAAWLDLGCFYRHGVPYPLILTAF